MYCSENTGSTSEYGSTERTCGRRGALEPRVEAACVKPLAARVAAETRQRPVVWMQNREADGALAHVGERALHRTPPHSNRLHN